MAWCLSLLVCILSIYAQYVSGQATTSASVVAPTITGPALVGAYVYPPLTVTGNFPCLTANSYMIFTDSTSSCATYPIWTCTVGCGSPFSGVGLMVFPATSTTGTYEVQNPPSGYPALEVSNLAVITDTTFSTVTSIDIAGPLPTTTSTFTYPAFPGLSLTVITTTPIPAVTATPISIPIGCPGGGGPGAGSTSGGSSAASVPAASSMSAGSTASTASVPGGPGGIPTSASGLASSASSQPGLPGGGPPSNSASSGVSSAASQPGGSTATLNPLSASSGQSSVSAPSGQPGGPNQSSSSGGVSFTSASSGQPGGSNPTSASNSLSAASPASIPVGSSNTVSALTANSASSGQSGGSNPASASSGLSASSASSNPAGGSNPTTASGGSSASSASLGQSGASNPPSASSGMSAISATSIPDGGSNPSLASSGQPTVPNSASSSEVGAPGGQSSTSSAVGQIPASNSASMSASASVSQVLPPGASVVTSIVSGAGGSVSASTVVETFLPTVISSLMTLTTPLTTSSIVTYGTSSTSAVPITVFPGGTAWQIPNVGPGTPILSPPTAAPIVGTVSANTASSGSGTSSGLSGFTTMASSNAASSNSASPGGGGGYLGPVPISAEPATLTAALMSQSSVNVIGLTTYAGTTTTPVYVQISSGVSSNGHTAATNGALPFPIFWSHTCWFCPPGLCFFCGISLHLPPGIYPPGSIKPPPGWTGPLPEITIGQDGSPTYPEEDPNDPEETNQPSNQPSSAQGSSNAPSQTSMASSQTSLASTGTQSTVSSQTSGGFECAQTGCAVCVDNDPPSAYQPPTTKKKRSLLVEREEAPYDGNLSPPAKNRDLVPQARAISKQLAKRTLPIPADAPWYGNQDLFLWTQYSDMNVVAGWVPLRQDPNYPSSALVYGLGTARFDAAVQGLYGCTSLIIVSTQGVWMSHLWENPSFAPNGVVNQANFQAHILNRLGPGDGTAEFPGLTQYLTTIFAANTKPVAIIMTPRNRFNPQPGVLMFQNQISQLIDRVQTIFGGVRTNSGQYPGSTLNGIPLVIDYTPTNDPISQAWTSAGKALFQYDPVQTRCDGVQWAMVRLWVEDRPLYTYQYYWVAKANQVVAPNAAGGNQKRQDQSADSTPPPSCLASMTATQSVSMGTMSNSGSISAPSGNSNSGAGSAVSSSSAGSAVSGSNVGSASSQVSSPATVAATTTSAGVNAATSLAALSLASVSNAAVAASAAQITQSPICVPGELTNSGNGGVENCLEAAFCECSSGTFAGTYVTLTGTNQCGYTTTPPASATWNPNDQICTMGLSATSLRPFVPTTTTTTGQYVFTETDLPVSGPGTTVYGCTATYHAEAGPVIGTYCLGSKTPLITIFPPIKTPTGAPAAPSCNSPADPQDASSQGDPTGYVPDPVFFEAAIGVFCGPECKGSSGCLSAVGQTLSSNMDAYKATFLCSDAQSDPGGNKTLNCEPDGWNGGSPPYWLASGIPFNLGIKLIDQTCQWTVDSDTCNQWLSNTLTGCPAAGLDWNECVAWTVGAGASAMSLSDWESDHPDNTW